MALMNQLNKSNNPLKGLSAAQQMAKMTGAMDMANSPVNYDALPGAMNKEENV